MSAPAPRQRNTRQREAILSVLNGAGGPLTPAEIRELAEATCPGLGIATVYRLLKSLIDEDQVSVVEIPGTAPRYEEARRPHHHHFYCRICGRAFELDRCIPGIDKLAPARFTVDGHDIILYGHCADCVDQSGKS